MTPEQQLYARLRKIEARLDTLETEIKATNRAIFSIMGKLNMTEYKQSMDQDD